MPSETASRMRASTRPALDLPPPFRLITLREVGDAFSHATKVAAEEGAGTLVYVGRFDLAEFAVVLEPEEPLETARRALYAGLTALADALAVHAPPEKPISFDWPDAVRVDGGLVGGARLAWPAGADENEPPAWLVFGGMIRTVAMGEGEPGLRPLSSALDEEGFDELGVGPPGRELRAPSDGRDRRLAGEGLWRGRAELSRAAGSGAVVRLAEAGRAAVSAATSTTTAIFWCGASARSRSSGTRFLRRSPARPGSIR